MNRALAVLCLCALLGECLIDQVPEGFFAIVFEGGPTAPNSERVQRTLSEYDVTATFMFSRYDVATYNLYDQVKRIMAAKHDVGCKLDLETEWSTLGETEIRGRLVSLKEWFHSKFGTTLKFISPKYDDRNLPNLSAAAAKCNLSIVVHNLDSEDYIDKPSKQMVESWKDKIESNGSQKNRGFIAVHRDKHENAVAALPDYLDFLIKTRGYSVKKISECRGAAPVVKPRSRHASDTSIGKMPSYSNRSQRSTATLGGDQSRDTQSSSGASGTSIAIAAIVMVVIAIAA